VGAWARRPDTCFDDRCDAPRTDLQRRLMALHVAQATPTPPSDSPARWPGVAIFCSLMFALFVVASGGWQ
jgi:hypothetical protein